MKLFLILLVFSSTNLFSGNTCSKGQVEKKEIEIEKKEIKEFEPIKKLPALSGIKKISILRETIRNVIKNKGNLNDKFSLFFRYGNRLTRANLLAFAVSYCDVKSVKILLKNDADIDIEYFPYLCGYDYNMMILSDKVFKSNTCLPEHEFALQEMYSMVLVKKYSKELEILFPSVLKDIVLEYLQ